MSQAVRFGAMLREWRSAKRLSQLALALEADLSPRHLSCIETGKAQPGRDVVMRLADTLEMPLRERNALLIAAGYAPLYPETPLGGPELGRMRRAVEFILAQQEPYPAFVIDRHWNVLAANDGAERFNVFLLGRPARHRNMVHQIFDPADLRPAIANWEEIAGAIIRHLQDDVAAAPTDDAGRRLLAEALAYPGVPARWRQRELEAAPSPLLNTLFERDGERLGFFSTITTFGAPRDVTLAEIRIECCFPIDERTAAACRDLAQGRATIRSVTAG